MYLEKTDNEQQVYKQTGLIFCTTNDVSASSGVEKEKLLGRVIEVTPLRKDCLISFFKMF